jgi:hypothetical protein
LGLAALAALFAPFAAAAVFCALGLTGAGVIVTPFVGVLVPAGFFTLVAMFSSLKKQNAS